MICGVQAIAEMAMIKVQGDREQAMSEAEWKQLSNLIENDRRERVRLTHNVDYHFPKRLGFRQAGTS